jgi:large subunit ribosomal protein L4
VATSENKPAGKLTLNVHNAQGQAVGTVDIDPAEFGGKISRPLLHEVVLMYLAKKAVRAATRMAILSKFVDGETIILDDLKLPEIGTRQVVDILEALGLGETTLLIGIASSEVDEDRTIYLSARNIKGVEVQPASQFNAYGVLRPKRLLLTRAALQELRQKGRAEAEEPAAAARA